MYRRFR